MEKLFFWLTQNVNLGSGVMHSGVRSINKVRIHFKHDSNHYQERCVKVYIFKILLPLYEIHIVIYAITPNQFNHL